MESFILSHVTPEDAEFHTVAPRWYSVSCVSLSTFSRKASQFGIAKETRHFSLSLF